MKHVLLAAAAASTFLFPAISQGQSNDADQIVIRGAHTPSFGQWRESLSHKLSDSLVYPRAFRTTGLAEGTVAIQFACGEDGTPNSVRLLRSSGDRSLDQAALKAATRIKGLHPLPAQLLGGETIRANLIFAGDNDSLDRQISALRKHEAQLTAEERRTGKRVAVVDARASHQG